MPAARLSMTTPPRPLRSTARKLAPLVVTALAACAGKSAQQRAPGAAPATPTTSTVLEVKGPHVLVGGQRTTLLGFRVGSAPLQDAWTDELIAQLPLWQQHGVNALILWVQGTSSGFHHVYAEDGRSFSTQPAPVQARTGYGADEGLTTNGTTTGKDVLARVRRIVTAADRHGMVAIVGVIYRRALESADTQPIITEAMRSTGAALREHRNVMFAIWNEANIGRPVENVESHTAYARALREAAPGRPICAGSDDRNSNAPLGQIQEVDAVCHDAGRTFSESVEAFDALAALDKPIINVESFGGDGGGFIDHPLSSGNGTGSTSASTAPARPGYFVDVKPADSDKSPFRRVFGAWEEDDYKDANGRALVGRKAYRDLIARIVAEPTGRWHLMVHAAAWFQGASRVADATQLGAPGTPGRWNNTFGPGPGSGAGTAADPGIRWLLQTMARARTAGQGEPTPPSARVPVTPLPTAKEQGYYFPPPGEGLAQQARRAPAEVGLRPGIVTALRGRARAFALWRHGYLAHLEGDFNQTIHVASLRKTWHAMMVGAAIEQGKIKHGMRAKVKEHLPELSGLDARATWWHLLTQSTGFDYPYGDHPDYEPGQMWTYSDLNARRLTDALARLYGKKGFEDDYAGVARAAYFDAIGLRGWQVRTREDGALFSFDLEDMGRLGLLALARGEWDGKTLVPRTFVEQLERKQTQGMKVNFDGPNDGRVDLYEARAAFPEAPYGYMTWTNTDGAYFPGADRGWAWGTGNGGHVIMWNHALGIVFAAHGLTSPTPPVSDGVPHAIERNIAGANPLLRKP